MTVAFAPLPVSQITPAEEEAIQALVSARRRNDQAGHLAALDQLGRVARRDAVRVMLLLDIARVVEAAVVEGVESVVDGTAIVTDSGAVC